MSSAMKLVFVAAAASSMTETMIISASAFAFGTRGVSPGSFIQASSSMSGNRRLETSARGVILEATKRDMSSVTSEDVEVVANEGSSSPLPGTAEMDVPWEELGFEFRPTKSHLRMTYKDGKWGDHELVEDYHINIHIGATALHYGQSCFEGLKAFAHEDGSVHVFRPDENAKRLRSSCERIMMPPISEKQFLDAISAVVKDNVAYVPPYGSNGALYLRPLLFGSGPRIGLQPADEYTFLIMVIPVGDYYKGGLKGVDAIVCNEYDRAAPRGVGHVKVAGNYAADLLPNYLGKEAGYPISLYLDAATQSTVEEFSTSNFVGINSKDRLYVTPKSTSVLPSITNLSLMQLASTEMDFKVEQREIKIGELENFDEVVACGTAVVVTPVSSVTHGEKKYEFDASADDDNVGDITMQLYNKVRAIQNGEVDDVNNWNMRVC